MKTRIQGAVAGALALFAVTACGGHSAGGSTAAPAAQSATGSAPVAFYSELEDEQHLASYVYLLTNVQDVDEACGVVDADLISIESSGTKESFLAVTGLLEKYLYDPNSPFRDEDIYSAVAERIIESRFAPDSLKIKARTDLKLISMNRRGTQAADFIYRDINGKDHRLYETRAEFTLLFFSNPGCPACKDIIDILAGDQHLLMLQLEGKLAVVNVYIDEDHDAWREYQKEYPEYWSCGYDPTFTIRKDIAYNVRAIPSLYLLGKDKTVLLKDPSNERIFGFLSQIPE